MDALAKYGTTCIVLINTLFGVIALVMLVGGVMVKLASNLVDDIGVQLLSSRKDQLGINAETAKIDLQDVKISDFIGEAANMFIGIGCGLLFLVFWAYCGTCCHSRWMLGVYAILLSSIILGEIAVVIIFAHDKSMIEDRLKGPMKESLKEYYTGPLGQDGLSKAWNAIMQLLHCCGVDGPVDFKDTLARNQENTTVCVCCSNVTWTNLHSDYNLGCYDKFWALIDNNKTIAIGIGCGVAAFEVVLLFLVIWIIRQTKPNKVQPS